MSSLEDLIIEFDVARNFVTSHGNWMRTLTVTMTQQKQPMRWTMKNQVQVPNNGHIDW
jgi:hypothetical protein